MDSGAAYARARHVSLPGDLSANSRLREDQAPKMGSWPGIAPSVDGSGQAAGKANALGAGPPAAAAPSDDQHGYSQLAGLLSYPQLSRGSTPGLDEQPRAAGGEGEWGLGAAQYSSSDASSQPNGGGSNRALPWNYSLFGDQAAHAPAIQSEWDAEPWPSSAPASADKRPPPS